MNCAVGFFSRNLVTLKVSLNSEAVGIFTIFLGSESEVTPRTRFSRET